MRQLHRSKLPKFPAATLAFYGPTDQIANKAVVGIVKKKGDDISDLNKWITVQGDIREDPIIRQEIEQFLKAHRVKSVITTDRIIGCPHEEGIDYPEGTACPRCPFWAGRDRFSGEMRTIRRE